MIQKPKGTYDLFGNDAYRVLYLQDLFASLMEKYNYKYIRTPLFESSELFHRGVGETTDIVTKETYDFIDRGNRNMTLRPEGTAGVVRSYIENKVYADPNIPCKYWYFGPMFRYERPQSGRCREFYQFGVETFGSNDPMLDAEVITIAVNFYKLVGLKGIKVNINSLGDTESRLNYKKALTDYFRPYLDDLCEDCKVRFEKNPLRLLDCKVDGNKDIFKKVPKTIDYLNETSKKHFDEVIKYLKAANIDFEVNPSVVRGLDYYTHTVFEVEAAIEGFGSQNVLCGGGRYDNLVKQIGGMDVPGVGYALGVERLVEAIKSENIDLPCENSIEAYIIPMSEEQKEYSFNLLNALRMSGFSVDIDFMSRNLKSNFKQSERLNAKYIIIIGEEEVKTNILTIKNNETKEESKVKLEEIVDFLDDEEECSCGGHCHHKGE